MAEFTTRVYLHHADVSDYLKLHLKMTKEGFTRNVVGDDGLMVELPPAEYHYEGPESRTEILAKAKKAAITVKSAFSVLVTESHGMSWHSFKRVKTEEAQD